MKRLLFCKLRPEDGWINYPVGGRRGPPPFLGHVYSYSILTNNLGFVISFFKKNFFLSFLAIYSWFVDSGLQFPILWFKFNVLFGILVRYKLYLFFKMIF